MDTKEIVTELYALRAGLSLIAREKDAYDAEVAAAEMSKNAQLSQAHVITDEKESFIKKAEVKFSKASENYDAVEKEYYDGFGDCPHYDIDKANKELKKAKRKMARGLVFGILFILLHLGFVGLSYVHNYVFIFSGFVFIPVILSLLAIGITVCMWMRYEVNETNYMVGIVVAYLANLIPYIVFMARSFDGDVSSSRFLFVLTCVATVPAACITLYYLIVGTSYNMNDVMLAEETKVRIEKSIKRSIEVSPRLIKKLDDAYKKKETLKRQLDKSKSDLQTAENDYKVNCEKINKQYVKTCAALLKPHAKIGSEIWDTLVKNYGKLLDVRDWHILDLIIWQLETGRAESLKEALQLADRETQTDRIVRAVASASEAIRQKIQVGFGSLQAQLDSNFAALSRSFADSARSISDKIDNSAASISAFSERQTNSMLALDRNIDKIVTQASLQTALMEKADISSEKLVTAVNKLREAQRLI